MVTMCLQAETGRKSTARLKETNMSKEKNGLRDTEGTVSPNREAKRLPRYPPHKLAAGKLCRSTEGPRARVARLCEGAM